MTHRRSAESGGIRASFAANRRPVGPRCGLVVGTRGEEAITYVSVHYVGFGLPTRLLSVLRVLVLLVVGLVLGSRPQTPGPQHGCLRLPPPLIREHTSGLSAVGGGTAIELAHGEM